MGANEYLKRLKPITSNAPIKLPKWVPYQPTVLSGWRGCFPAI